MTRVYQQNQDKGVVYHCNEKKLQISKSLFVIIIKMPKLLQCNHKAIS